MHIMFQQADGAARTALSVEVETGEVSPELASLLFDVSPSSVSATQTAVAGALLYGAGALKRLKVNGEMLDTAVAELSQVIGFPVESDSVTSIDNSSVGQLDSLLKVTSLRVSLGLDLAHETPGRDETSLTLIPSERFYGGLLGIKEAVVASNAWLHATYVDPARVMAAAGVLFANDFLAEGLTLPDVSGEEKDIISRLCRIAGLETTFEAIG